MMNASPKGYNELVHRLLAPEDREKFETIVGSMLSGGTARVVVICGPERSGKTTLTKLVHKLAIFSIVETGRRVPQVVFQKSGYSPVESDSFVFVETKDFVAPHGAIFICTTGDRLPLTKYYALMHQIDLELDDIAEYCIQTYHNNLENNR